MKYIESGSTDPYFNMAFEEYIFESMPTTDEYFMLWQNDNAIVVGKYQNTIEEIDQEFVRDNNIRVVRRLSGGGAMYQDMGNLNFTFIVDQSSSRPLDFSIFTLPVVKALKQIGIEAQNNSRNDITIDGRKFSGNAQYNRRGRTMHHGTLLFDSDLSIMPKALTVKQDKIESKGIKSLRSRVTNISEYLPEPLSIGDFKKILLKYMFEGTALTEYRLNSEDIKHIEKLRDEKYSTWKWNYGSSPRYNLTKERKFSLGKITVLIDVDKGVIKSIRFYGDFFGNGNLSDIENCLENTEYRYEAIRAVLKTIDTGSYINGLNSDELTDIIIY